MSFVWSVLKRFLMEYTSFINLNVRKKIIKKLVKDSVEILIKKTICMLWWPSLNYLLFKSQSSGTEIKSKSIRFEDVAIVVIVKNTEKQWHLLGDTYLSLLRIYDKL